MADYLHALPSGYRIEEYELVRVLGSGGFGITYLGYDHHLDKAVAIKEYLPNDLAVRTDNQSVLPKAIQDQADYEWGLERFLSEAQTLARFDHRHIIKIHRFFRAHGTGYSVMEYAEGETLSALLQRKSTLTEVELKRILFPILDGLEAVHRADFLHRDIKPGNIVIRDDGSPVLIDFGSARQAVAGKSRSVTAIVTPGYAPIEQYSVKGHQGPWTDIYALGSVCYRCLTGEPPNDAAERLREDPLVPAAERCKGKASAALLGAIDRALLVDERDRPQSIAAWRKMLAGVPESRKDTITSAGKSVTAKGSATTGKRKSRADIVLVAMIVLLLGASAWRGWQLYQDVPSNDASETVTLVEQEEEVATDTSQTGNEMKTAPGLVEQEMPVSDASKTVTEVEQQADVAMDTTQARDEAENALQTGRSGTGQPTLKQEASRPEEDEITRLLEAAEADMMARRLTFPAGNNAWDKYRRVLELEPAHPEAIAGMERVMASYQGLFAEALAQEEFDKAAGYLARIRELNPDSLFLAEGEQRLATVRQAEGGRQTAKARARDLAGEMVYIPGGTFRMGDLNGEGYDSEKPVHSVTVSAFKLGKYEVTVSQFRRFVLATGYRTLAEKGAGNVKGCNTLEYETRNEWGYTPGRSWRDLGYPIEEDQPVVCVGWHDAFAYVHWLSEQTGNAYRLPSEAEWEYAVRAGSETLYHFGDEAERLCEFGNVADMTKWPNGNVWTKRTKCDDGAVFPTSVGSYRSNAFGLYDMHGNVREWVEDCWNDNYAGAPNDGSAWTSGTCDRRVIRGGSFDLATRNLRSANRNWGGNAYRTANVGFRLAQDL